MYKNTWNLSRPTHVKCAPLAKWLMRSPCKRKVASSTLAGGTHTFFQTCKKQYLLPFANSSFFLHASQLNYYYIKTLRMWILHMESRSLNLEACQYLSDEVVRQRLALHWQLACTQIHQPIFAAYHVRASAFQWSTSWSCAGASSGCAGASSGLQSALAAKAWCREGVRGVSYHQVLWTFK